MPRLEKNNYLISDYNYQLPEQLIAQKPADPRDQSRMLVLTRKKGQIGHKKFTEFPTILDENSILVVNNSKVIPARLPGERATGGRIEALLVREQGKGVWLCKLKNMRAVKPGEDLLFCQQKIKARLVEKNPAGTCLIQFEETKNLYQLLERYGYAPIPPYIRKSRGDQKEMRVQDLTTYQTIFAQQYGAVAAPTAGLHFSQNVMQALEKRGVDICSITLHVGLGTFEPIRVEDIREHKMHKEYYEISPSVAEKLTVAKKAGRKIVALGTTTVRTLESAWQDNQLKAGISATEIFIHPPYQFKLVDQLLTNFHLPESSLLMLVSAFAGRVNTLRAYQEAIAEKYRFYSYGDCMFIQ
jgi:S-adenosylmethionine:tRNA ribosyltransferase-isomerase